MRPDGHLAGRELQHPGQRRGVGREAAAGAAPPRRRLGSDRDGLRRPMGKPGAGTGDLGRRPERAPRRGPAGASHAGDPDGDLPVSTRARGHLDAARGPGEPARPDGRGRQAARAAARRLRHSALSIVRARPTGAVRRDAPRRDAPARDPQNPRQRE